MQCENVAVASLILYQYQCILSETLLVIIVNGYPCENLLVVSLLIIPLIEEEEEMIYSSVLLLSAVLTDIVY